MTRRARLRSRRAGLLVLVVVLAVGLAVGAVPAAAQTVEGQAPGPICVRDRVGDQRAPRNPDRPDVETVPEGGADLVEVCLLQSGGVVITTAAATGLGTDPRWVDGASAISVGVDQGGDGAAETVVQVATTPAGEVLATVLTTAGEVVGSCPVEVEESTAEVAAAEAVVEVRGDCLAPLLDGLRPPAPDHGGSSGGAGRFEPQVGIQASLRLAGDPQVEYAPTVVDVAPDGRGVVREDGSVAGAPPGAARLAGPTRIDTAVEISRAEFPGGAPTAYLARADDLTDAVAGGSLRDGPVLLVPACDGVPGVVAAEIDRLDPAEVVVLGGTSAVCEDTLIEAATGRAAGRLAGADRFTTAAAIVARAYPGGADDVFLARVDDLADAIAAGSLETGPVLLVPACGALPDGVRSAIRRILPNRVIALGGEAAVCEDLLQQAVTGDAGQRTLAPLRLDGADRFETAALIADRRSPGGAPVVFLARADDPADAVAGGVLTAGPTLLVPRCGPVTDATAAALAQVRPDRIVTLGGDAAVCAATLDEAVEVAGLPGG